MAIVEILEASLLSLLRRCGLRVSLGLGRLRLLFTLRGCSRRGREHGVDIADDRDQRPVDHSGSRPERFEAVELIRVIRRGLADAPEGLAEQANDAPAGP